MFLRAQGLQGNRDMCRQAGSDEYSISLDGCQGRMEAGETTLWREVEELLYLHKHPCVQVYTGDQFNILTLLYNMGSPIPSPTTHTYLHKTNRHRASFSLRLCHHFVAGTAHRTALAITRCTSG